MSQNIKETEVSIANKTLTIDQILDKVVNPVKHYNIYHAYKKGKVFMEVEDQPRKYVGTIHASSLQEAYIKGQNTSNCTEYVKLKSRSVSVGDMIQDDFGFYMVCGVGFKLVCENDPNLE